MSGQIEKILFFLTGWWKRIKIALVDDHVTGRARHHPFTGTFEGFASCPGDIEQTLPGLRIHFFVETAVETQKPDPYHASSFSCSTATAAMRLQASTSSCCFV